MSYLYQIQCGFFFGYNDKSQNKKTNYSQRNKGWCWNRFAARLRNEDNRNENMSYLLSNTMCFFFFLQ